MNSFFTFFKKNALFKKIGVAILIIIAILLLTLLYKTLFNRTAETQTSFDSGNYSEIIKDYEKKQSSGDATSKDLELLVASYIQKANAEPLEAQSSLNKAEVILKDMIKTNTQNEEAHRLLATVYLSENKLNEAKVEFENTLKIGSGNANARAGLGLVLERQGKLVQASASFLYASKIDPKNDLAILGLARYYISEKRFQDAIKNAEMVVNNSKNVYSISEAYHTIGASYIGLENQDRAIFYFEKSLAINPNAISTMILASEAYSKRYMKDPTAINYTALDKASAYIEKVLSINPDYIYAHTSKFKISLLKGQYPEAQEIANKILSLLSKDQILTETQKKEYKKYYSEKVIPATIKSVKLEQINK